jgi:tryptophan synthase
MSEQQKSGAQRLREAVGGAKELKGRPAFVAFVTCGFPKPSETVDIMLALQKGGADVIELGIPFSDPIADGPTIQLSSFEALEQGVTMSTCFSTVESARNAGVAVPIVLMGYFNPFMCYGETKALERAAEVGVDGFIVVDLPPCGPESRKFRSLCAKHGLSLVPLVAPTTADDRLKDICATADGFIYCVAVTGVTGKRQALPTHLRDYIERVRAASDAPLAVGFGISDHEQFCQVGEHADGVVIGSAIIRTVHRPADSQTSAQAAFQFANFITTGKQ